MRGSAAFALALLCGCVNAPVPQYSKTSFQPVSADASSRRLCLVLTENTERALAHVNEASNRLRLNGDRLLAELSDALKTRFGNVERVASLELTKGRACSVVLGLDMKTRVGAYPNEEVSVELVGTFLDGQGGSLDTVRGEGIDVVPNPGAGLPLSRFWGSALAPVAPNAGAPFSKVWNTALAGFTRGVDESRPIAMVRELPASASGAPAPVRLSAAVPAGGVRDFGAYHALVIGINDYRAVAPLKTAVNDARTVADLLQKEYGFKTTLLVDATRNQILDAFDDLRRRLTEKDNLLIYYAGHGHLDTDSDRGFWLPVDADANRRANWLSNSDIADVVRATRAKHVLVVADSCYAGTLTRSLTIQLSGLDDLTRLAQKRARTALVSGGLEPVEDAGGGGHSVFARAFLDGLLANTGAVETSQIFSSMRRQVLTRASQTPQYGDIRQTGHEGGDFIFVRQR
jgi:Caspase domain